MRFIKQICFILVHSRDFHDNPFIVKECSIKFPNAKGTKPYLH